MGCFENPCLKKIIDTAKEGIWQTAGAALRFTSATESVRFRSSVTGSSLHKMGHDGCAGTTTPGIRAGENPAYSMILPCGRREPREMAVLIVAIAVGTRERPRTWNSKHNRYCSGLLIRSWFEDHVQVRVLLIPPT